MHKHTKRWTAFAMAMTLILMLLTGCGAQPAPSVVSSSAAPSSGGESTVDGEQVVRLWTFLDPEADNGRSKALKQMIETFESENPGIKIVVETQDWEQMTPKFFAAHAAGNAPDIIWCIMDEMGAALDLGALEPLENLFLKDWTEEEIADIDDSFFNFGVRDGKHYQITHSRNYMAMYYRADLFEEKGLEVPKTWDEFIEVCQALTEVDSETGIQRYGFGQAFNVDKVDPQIMTSLLLDTQGNLFTDDGKANWANAAGEEALQFQLECITKYGITPEAAVNLTGEELFTEFAAGKYAIITGGAVRVPTVRADVPFEPSAVQLMLYPSADGNGNSPSTINGWCVGVWSGSKVKEAAGKFVEAMMSPESDELWVTLGGQLAIRKSTMEKLGDFYEDPNNRYLTVVADGITNAGWPQPTDYPVSSWKNDLNRAAQMVMVDGSSIPDALASVAKDFDERNGG